MPFEGTIPIPSPGFLAPKRDKSLGPLKEQEIALVINYLNLTNSVTQTARFAGISEPTIRKIKRAQQEDSPDCRPATQEVASENKPKREKNIGEKTRERVRLLELHKQGLIPSLSYMAPKVENHDPASRINAEKTAKTYLTLTKSVALTARFTGLPQDRITEIKHSLLSNSGGANVEDSPASSESKREEPDEKHIISARNQRTSYLSPHEIILFLNAAEELVRMYWKKESQATHLRFKAAAATLPEWCSSFIEKNSLTQFDIATFKNFRTIDRIITLYARKAGVTDPFALISVRKATSKFPISIFFALQFVLTACEVSEEKFNKDRLLPLARKILNKEGGELPARLDTPHAARRPQPFLSKANYARGMDLEAV